MLQFEREWKSIICYLRRKNIFSLQSCSYSYKLKSWTFSTVSGGIISQSWLPPVGMNTKFFGYECASFLPKSMWLEDHISRYSKENFPVLPFELAFLQTLDCTLKLAMLQFTSHPGTENHAY